MPTEEEYSYLAGLIDGEGCISSFGNGRGYYMIQLRISQSGHRILTDWLHEHFGGTINEYPGATPNRQRRYRWRVTGSAAAELLSEVQPYLRGPKKEEIPVALEIWENRKDNPIDLHVQLSAMKRIA
jgi:hypothetical protein